MAAAKSGNVYAVVGIVMLGFSIKFLGVGAPMASFHSGSQVSTASANTAVEVSGRILDISPASDGRPIVKLLTSDGYQVSVYISDDARAPALDIGRSYKFQARVMGDGFLVASTPGGISKLTDSAVADHTETAAVEAGFAYIQTASGTVRVPSTSQTPGRVEGQIVIVDGHAKFQPSSQAQPETNGAEPLPANP